MAAQEDGGVGSVIAAGCTRFVLLIGPWAVKVPRPDTGWAMMLRGMLGNMQEAAFWVTGWRQLCPVLWSIPGGFLIVMRRARPLTDSEWADLTWERHCAFREVRVNGEVEGVAPVEYKRCSYGYLGDRLVAVDYGS